MIQATIPEEKKVRIDFETSDFSRTVKVLNPTVYQEGESYFCLLGPDLVTGILGLGRNPIDAIKDWEVNVHHRISSPAENDEVAQYVIDALSTSKKDVW